MNRAVADLTKSEAPYRGLRLRWTFAILYFSEGAPIGFIWNALPARLRAQGVDVAEITSLAAVLVLPWAFKFAWAPLVDILRGKHWTLRHWILGAQSVMVGTLVPLAWLDLSADFATIRMLLLAHAFAAATQDAAIDALAVRMTDASERGRLNGWMQAGSLAGRALLGGGALVLFAWIGHVGVIVVLVATTAASAILVVTMRAADMPEGNASGERSETRRIAAARLGRAARAALSRPATWYGIAFALTGGAAFEALGAISGPMLVDAGFTEKSVGIVLAGPVIVGMVAGALFGGRLADRRGHARIVILGILAVSANVGLVGALHLAGLAGAPGLLPILLTTNAVAVGVLTASSYALFMDLTHPGLAATQFSAFMGATNACESWAAFLVGRLVADHGYATALFVVAALPIATIVLVVRIAASGETRACRDRGGVS